MNLIILTNVVFWQKSSKSGILYLHYNVYYKFKEHKLMKDLDTSYCVYVLYKLGYVKLHQKNYD